MFETFSEKCGKLLFLTEKDAQVRIVEREADHPDWHGKAYQCTLCHHWHITTVKNDSTNKDSVNMYDDDTKPSRQPQHMKNSIAASLDPAMIEKLQKLL